MRATGLGSAGGWADSRSGWVVVASARLVILRGLGQCALCPASSVERRAQLAVPSTFRPSPVLAPALLPRCVYAYQILR